MMDSNEKKSGGLRGIMVPDGFNYIAAFLTFACNLTCSYCIVEYGGKKKRPKPLSGEEWVTGLNRINSREDLPVTLQGGEPTLHKEFIHIINNIKPELNIDILTNLQFEVDEFISKIDKNRIKRKAPYASIRVSYHAETMKLDELIKKTMKIQNAGFSIGIWGVMHPSWEKEVMQAKEECEREGIDFRTKEFLGKVEGDMYGTYKYDAPCELNGAQTVLCKPSELLIGTSGNIYRCHSDLYEGREPVGNILDGNYEINEDYTTCNYYGHCNPCDVKLKTNRFQEFGHTSVDIKG
jgi:sulfatase maturation enzyme AslB (radical SAM superfamily)